MRPHKEILHVLIAMVSSFITINTIAQENDKKTLSEEEFISIVRSFHPVVKQAELITAAAKAQLTVANAGFDPLITADRTQKTFDGTNYYNYLNPQIKIPAWYGIDIYAGMENNSGLRTDESVSPGKSSYTGLSVPVLKGLLIDRRRADLKQAKLFVKQSEQEQRIVINDLLYEAASAYWNWVKEYLIYNIVSEALNNNKQRYDFILNSALLGERAMMDTVEAAAQLQNFEYLHADAWMKFRSAGYELSNFMWLQNDSAYELKENIVPDIDLMQQDHLKAVIPSLQSVLDEVIKHPKLRTYDYKLDILNVEKKYKFQLLLPKFDLKYQVLSKQYFEFNKWGGQYLENNHRFGFNVAVPLFMREGRGQYKLAKIKIRDAQYEQMRQRLQLQNKIRSAHNELMGYRTQLSLKSAAVDNYRKMLLAENERFREGESSVFLINSRENKLIDESQKLAELKTKFYKSIRMLQWSAGRLQ